MNWKVCLGLLLIPSVAFAAEDGFSFGKLFRADSAEQKEPPQRLQGSIANPDVKGEKRCGVAAPSEPCVLYIMNHFSYDKMAQDFFDTAVTLTKRPSYLIKVENIHYVTYRIPPGYFVEIKIPALQ